ncbi:MAG TPA: hypothetical protein IAD06_05515 [Candidatus Caccoplasma intestinavium]|uniref:Uncharacterized protein n=1 Tax=Candidatus Caccoplasma intestinavium TaxID=2840716 RepID=A0A9D1KEI2_9BACT|nr:hypothetical protein [Candidatus Caccoplasma intestinavium]
MTVLSFRAYRETLLFYREHLGHWLSPGMKKNESRLTTIVVSRDSLPEQE